MTAIIAAVVAGCGSSGGSSSGGGGGGKLTVAVFMPFSGPDALFGAVGDAGTVPAINAINAAGGVLGHKFTYKNVDTRGDPADAVPAAQQMLASTSGLVGTEGPTSDEASATVPIINRAGIPMNIGSGQTVFNKNTYAYVWRNTPPDDGDGAAIAYYAHGDAGYTKAAAVFGNDISSQGAEPSAIATFKGLGGQIVATENVQLDATSYETEVAKVIAAHPQVIFTEADPQTSATFFRDLGNAGGLVPFIGADGTNGHQWLNAVKKGIGASKFNRLYKIVQFGAPPSEAANLYNQALLKSGSGIQKPLNQWVNNPYGLSEWDFITSEALAMLEAHSVDPHKFNPYIAKVTAPSSGAVKVDSFAAGKKALAAGKKIQFVGGLGLTVYNRYHNSAGTFLVQAANQTTIVKVIPGTTVSKLLSQYGG
jgi:ABC-type branched-subunit amino acid transport system substrate-binding protein